MCVTVKLTIVICLLQYIEPYSFARKTRKWYRKLACHLLQKAQLNAWILFKKDGGTKSYLEFQKEMIGSLLFSDTDIHVPDRSEHIARLTERHFIKEVDHSDKTGRHLRKKCRVCFKKGRRQDTIYCCRLCPSKPGLCLSGCFEAYHSRLNYWAD